MEAVEEALYQDFESWRETTRGNKGNSYEEDINLFMEAEYAMKVGKGNIFDTIRALVLPPTSFESPSSSAALENQAKCREDKELKSNRPKRATTSGKIITLVLFLESPKSCSRATLGG